MSLHDEKCKGPPTSLDRQTSLAAAIAAAWLAQTPDHARPRSAPCAKNQAQADCLKNLVGSAFDAGSPTFVTDYGTDGRISETIALINQWFNGDTQNRAADPVFMVCKDAKLSRTTARYENGLSKEEIMRMSGGGAFMARTGESLYWAVLGDELLDLESGEARKRFERFTTQLVIAQRREGLPQYWLRGFEATGGLHCNVVFVGTEKIARNLHRSFAPYMRGNKAMQEVEDINRLTSRYLSKERTTQANWALGWRHSTRLRGSHRIEGGGDRVTLSPALKRAAIAANYVEPWQVTNAKRLAA